MSALRLGNILIIREEKRGEQKRIVPVPVPLLPSVKTLHSISWLSSVSHLNLRETRDKILVVVIVLEFI